MKTLRQRWTLFWNIVADPGAILLFLITLGLLAASQQTTPVAGATGAAATVFAVLSAIVASVLGARAWQMWLDANAEAPLTARGHLSVRNLNLLLRGISSLNLRLESFLKHERHIEGNPEVTKRNYEEAIRDCGALMEQTVSAIESWTDIVPGASLKTQIGKITELTQQLNETETELSRTQASLAAVQGQQSEERSRLEKKLMELQAALGAQKRQLQVASVTGPYGSINTGGVTLSELVLKNILKIPTGATKIIIDTPDQELKTRTPETEAEDPAK